MNNSQIYTIEEELKKGVLEVLNELNGEAMYLCKICSVSISGKMQAVGHVNGTKHKKKIQIQPISPSNNLLFQALPKKDIKLNNIILPKSEEKEEAIQMNSLFCEVCQVGLNGEQPMKQHLAGKSHLKKVHMYGKGNSASANCSSQEIGLSNTIANPTFSVTASKVDSTSLGKRVNSSSIVHLSDFNNTIQLSGTENIFKNNIAVVKMDKETVGTNSLFCKVCKVLLSGEQPMIQHLKGKSHAKTLKNRKLFVLLDRNNNCHKLYNQSPPLAIEIGLDFKVNSSNYCSRSWIESSTSTNCSSQEIGLSEAVVNPTLSVVGSKVDSTSLDEEINNSSSVIYLSERNKRQYNEMEKLSDDNLTVVEMDSKIPDLF